MVVSLSALSAFKHFQPDEALAKRRQILDIILTIVLVVVVGIYAGIEGYRFWDNNTYQAACYSTGEALPGGEKALKVKHLCWTKETEQGPEPKGWAAFALKTFTCRGDNGALSWGVIARSGQRRLQAPPPGGNPPPPTQNGDPTAGTPPTKTAILAPHDQPKFCAQVIHNGEGELRAFVNTALQDGCKESGCHEDLDTSIKYSFGDSTDKYYLKEGQPEGYTCCGFRPLGAHERLLLWLGAVGGFSGIAKAALALCPPYAARKLKDEGDLETSGPGGAPQGSAVQVVTRAKTTE